MPQGLVNLISQYGAAILGVSVFLMNMGIPVPGHLSYVAAVLLASQGKMSLPLVVATAVPAAFFGGWVGFLVGQRGGHDLVVTYGPKVGLTAARFQAMERFYERHGGAAVFFSRFVIMLRTFGNVFAGLNEVPTHKFLVVNAAGALAWGAVYATVLTLFGESWHLVDDWLGVIGLVGLGLLALVGLGHIVWLRRRKRRGA
jgi:membrane protein DedA with SNARE-associated domain